MTKPELLVRSYPKPWRERYGEEFAALLADAISERPRDRKRDLDVVRAGLTARLTTPASALAAVLVFLAAAASIWTQLARGTTNAHPDMAAVTLGLVTLSICGLAVATIAIAGAAGLCVAATKAVRRGEGRRLLGPAAATGIGAVTLVLGAARIGAHAHTGNPIVRWTWAATETLSTYWVHPTRLLALPAVDIAWMIASPLAAIACWRGLAELAARTNATWQRMSRPLVFAVLTPALVTAATWVIGSQHNPNASLRAGTLDLALIVAMTAAVLTIDATARRHQDSIA